VKPAIPDGDLVSGAPAVNEGRRMDVLMLRKAPGSARAGCLSQHTSACRTQQAQLPGGAVR